MRRSIVWLSVIGLVFLQSCHAEDNQAGHEWKDGFLEKNYTISQETLDKALNGIFVKCVAVETTVLEGENGAIVSWGVGDKNGKWGIWTGVDSIKELNIKDGGVVVAVKTFRNGETVTVGFKVGDGDRESSQILQELLLTGLAQQQSPDATEQKEQQASGTVQAKEEETDSVSLSYSRGPTVYQERDENGMLAPPAARFHYDDRTQKDVTVTATVGGTTRVCHLIYQDVVYELDKEGRRGRRVPIFGYQGCPFTIYGPLQVRTEGEMREEVTIEIEKASGSILWVSSNSARPMGWESAGMTLVTGCEMLINTTWVFKAKGMEFVADGQTFITETGDATIKFTKGGVVMDGVSKK